MEERRRGAARANERLACDEWILEAGVFLRTLTLEITSSRDRQCWPRQDFCSVTILFIF
jgi:hypothetical protein